MAGGLLPPPVVHWPPPSPPPAPLPLRRPPAIIGPPARVNLHPQYDPKQRRTAPVDIGLPAGRPDAGPVGQWGRPPGLQCIPPIDQPWVEGACWPDSKWPSSRSFGYYPQCGPGNIMVIMPQRGATSAYEGTPMYLPFCGRTLDGHPIVLLDGVQVVWLGAGGN